jgi:hypothetical protein
VDSDSLHAKIDIYFILRYNIDVSNNVYKVNSIIFLEMNTVFLVVTVITLFLG